MSDLHLLIGIVNGELEVPIFSRLDSSQYLPADAVIDTGFNGSLMLPGEVCEQLDLEPIGMVSGSLADGSETVIPVYSGGIQWGDEIREVEIVAAGQTPLVGTQLLSGFKLVAEIVPFGNVSLSAIDPELPETHS